MFFEEADRLLQPGYEQIETGYYPLSNGQMHVAVLTRMPNCKGEMVEHWYKFLISNKTYLMWHKKSHLAFKWDKKWMPGHYIGASYISKKNIEGRIIKTRVHFHNPFEFLDTAKFKKAGIGTVICANTYDLNNVPRGRIIHLVRDTEYGCEMRSRFWLFNASNTDCIIVMQHCIEEMGSLADFLPSLYAHSRNRFRNKSSIVHSV